MTIDLIKLVEQANSLRPLTKVGYRLTVQQWLTFAGADPTGWTVPVCQAFYDHLLATGLSPKSANGKMTGGLSFVFRRANAMFGFPNIVAGTDLVKPTADPDDALVRHALTSHQARALLAACDGDDVVSQRDHALVVLGLYTGMRVTSLRSLDTSNAMVMGGWVNLKVELKGGAWYYVPIDPRAWALTEPYRRQLARLRPTPGPMFTRIPRPQVTVTAPLGVSVPGTRLTSIYAVLKARAGVAKLPTFHPHKLRHTFVTWCRVARVEPDLVAVITGHKRSPSGMVGYYTDKAALYEQAVLQCYEAVTKQLAG